MNSYLPAGPDTCLSILASCDRYSQRKASTFIYARIESFELAFQCRWFELNQHHVAEVMPVLLKSGQSVSQEEAVEDEGLSIDGAPLVSIDGDARIWVKHIL
ncbi:hypothetical protein F2Q70_00026238 [Brassica cretica]|uniref:Uncharacterized protein n=1 Tax=Brassica cretica TaxID=69181 RepID=A0A8S9L372_BRACR|nr:hypothetical protein F2Q70_00026238 [Brassica cretica]